MITDSKLIQISKFLSLVLRHKPHTIGIELDSSGWTSVDDLIEKMNHFGKKIDLDTLNLVIENNNKKRFELNPDHSKIRASQGHSVEVNLGYTPQLPPELLYHGTADKFAGSILKSGLQRQKRHHVHLSFDIDTAKNVGQRHGKPVIFEISSGEMHANGFIFYLSTNGVWLTDNVPVKYLRLTDIR